MLQQIRDRTSGLVAGFIVAIIVIPFAFFGIDSFSGGGGDPVVAKVGGQKIRESQFRAAYDQRYRQLQALMGENFRSDMFDQAKFREAVLQDLTQEAMLRQHTEEMGFRANDAVLFNTISSIPAFQTDGKFDSELYRSRLSMQGQTPDRFESQLRDSVEMDQLRSVVVDTAFVVSSQAQANYKLATQTRTLAYLQFDPARYATQVSISDDEVKARYAQDQSRYMAPERLKLAYVELSLDTLPPVEAPSDDVLKVLYDAEKGSRFTTQEERKARHILVAFGADKGTAKQKIEAAAAKLKGGADFAALARELSDDTGSKGDGGDLGWVKRGQMVESFEQALFGLKTGEVSAPVETEFGWHLIRTDEIKASVVRSLDEPAVRAELVELYRNRERQKRYQESLEKLEQLAFETPGSLEPVAEALGLTVQTTDWVQRAGGAGLMANEAVRAAAFSPEVLTDGENSKPLQAGENTVVVIRKAEYEAPRQRTLEEVAEDVRKTLRDEAALARTQADAAEALKAARAGTPLEQVAQSKGVELKSPGLVARTGSSEDPKLIEALFKMARPAAGAASFEQVTLSAGGLAVLMLGAVNETGYDPEQAAQETARLRDLVAGGEFAAYRKAVEREIEVEIVKQPEAEAPVDPAF
jgi:peptidyl-prolyl cis-trans isomerase D